MRYSFVEIIIINSKNSNLMSSRAIHRSLIFFLIILILPLTLLNPNNIYSDLNRILCPQTIVIYSDTPSISPNPYEYLHLLVLLKLLMR